jgi:hypothetical protein
MVEELDAATTDAIEFAVEKQAYEWRMVAKCFVRIRTVQCLIALVSVIFAPAEFGFRTRAGNDLLKNAHRVSTGRSTRNGIKCRNL